MKGLVFTGNRGAALHQFPDPVAQPGQAVIRVRASGLCGTDLHRYRAADPPTYIAGHEPCGVIEQLGAGSVAGLRVGDRVMVYHYAGCGVCSPCAMGFEQACTSGEMVYFGGPNGHGGHAELLVVPARNLVPLPDELSFETGAVIGCGAGTAWSALVKLQASGRDMTVVFGQGPVGLAATQFAKAMGATVIAVDVNAQRLQIAEQLGADHTVDASCDDVVAAIDTLTKGAMASAVVESSGAATARRQAVQVAATFGRVAYVGLGEPAPLDLNLDVIRKVVTVYGSWTLTKAEFVDASAFVARRHVDLDAAITHRCSLDDAVDLYREFDAGSTGKCMITFD